MKNKSTTLNEVLFEIPILLPTLNTYSRWHWKKQREHTRIVSLLVKEALGLKFIREHSPYNECILIVQRHSTKDPKAMDWDNVFAGLKSLCDSLTVKHKHGNNLIVDDSTACILATPTMILVKCKKGEEKAVIKIIKIS